MSAHPQVPLSNGFVDAIGNTPLIHLRRASEETGCTIHFVTDELDAGPILIQKKCKVNPDDTIHSLKFKVQQLEGAAFLEAIEIFNSDKRN